MKVLDQIYFTKKNGQIRKLTGKLHFKDLENRMTTDMIQFLSENPDINRSEQIEGLETIKRQDMSEMATVKYNPT